jgi:hypothetical protein
VGHAPVVIPDLEREDLRPRIKCVTAAGTLGRNGIGCDHRAGPDVPGVMGAGTGVALCARCLHQSPQSSMAALTADVKPEHLRQTALSMPFSSSMNDSTCPRLHRGALGSTGLGRRLR